MAAAVTIWLWKMAAGQGNISVVLFFFFSKFLDNGCLIFSLLLGIVDRFQGTTPGSGQLCP
jgi:hypothetical protein